MWAFLLGTRLGLCLGLSAVVGVLLLGAWIAGAHWRAGKDAARIATLSGNVAVTRAANVTNQVTIDNLKAANAKWATEAAQYRDQMNHAASTLATQQADSDAALKRAQQALKDAINAEPDAKRLGNTRVPDAVLVRLCAHASHCPHPHG